MNKIFNYFILIIFCTTDKLATNLLYELGQVAKLLDYKMRSWVISIFPLIQVLVLVF